MPKRQQVRKYITQKKGSTWEETEEVQLWENRDRWRGFIARCPQKVQHLRKINNEQGEGDQILTGYCDPSSMGFMYTCRGFAGYDTA